MASFFATPAAPSSAFATASAVLSRRQETCALTCLAGTDAGACTALDASCLCASDAWGEAVLSCIQSTCESELSLDTAYSQLLLYCQTVDVAFTLAEPAYTGTATADAAATSSVAAAASSSAAAVQLKPVNVSAIMAGICSLLFVVALLIGYFGVKEKLAKQREQSTIRPVTWNGGKQAAAGQKLAATGSAARPGGGASSSTKANNASVGTHSSLFGGASSNFDGAGYADLEMEDRQQQARRARLAAEAERQKNLNSLFTVAPTADASSSSKSLASLASGSKSQPNLDADSDDGDNDDNAQYVTLPALGKGSDDVDGPLPTASTFAPSDADGWARSPTTTAAGDSTVALTKDEPASTSKKS